MEAMLTLRPMSPSLLPEVSANPAIMFHTDLSPVHSRSPSLPSIKVQIPRAQKQQDQITRNEGRVNPQIPPPVPETQLQGLIKLIPDLVRAITTHITDIADDITRGTSREKVAHVFSTILPGWGWERVEFRRFADDAEVVEFCRHHTGNKACKGVEFIEPVAPKARDLRLGDGDAAEEGECDDDKRVDQAGYKTARRHCRQHLTQRNGEQFRDQDHEELISRSRGSIVEAR